MKSKEEIIDKHYERGMHWKLVNRGNVLEAMEEYAQQFKDRPQWIKASERLPEKDGRYFVKDANGSKNTAVFDVNNWHQRAVNKAVFEWLSESGQRTPADDAVEFAEWLGKENVVCCGVNVWQVLGTGHLHSTTELYKLFKGE